MGVGNTSGETAGNYVHSGVNGAIVNPLGVGGSKLTSQLADPLGLFNGGGRDRSLSYDANGNAMIGGQPYDPNRIYTNPKKAEAANQVRIKAGTSAVNSIFDSPERLKQRQDFLTSLRDYYSADANKQKGIADRNLRFSMARGGLTGGSASNDANRNLGEEYQKALLTADQKAQGAYSDLQGQDEQTRLNLLSMVRSGLDTTTAGQRAGALMQSNAASAQSNALTNGLGDVFGSTAQIYKTQQAAADRRRGALDAYGSIYGPKNPYSG
jgi:hypothetical protein